MNEFALRFPEEIERQLGKVKATVRKAIQVRLQEIAEAAANPSRVGTFAAKGPPLRFYVFDGYRVCYQVDPDTRSVIILELQIVPA